ncbi:GNAT family N-acetyltransferase [Croceivirga thetidis]|uniref:GNAT family N-acetyltransferase n=1 Tax=Croceivirga thetidis TaxID=2721623 RepID=A0ABX1GLS3_9FLAO|nr:GNAT family N-acetyltransferase [Croceivirga thetidis]NKI30841.1 GNAT family N-acetyltransferase [Croceivirga thetidis]
MEFSIREAVRSDMKSVHALITELAVFEKEPEAVKVTIGDLERDGFGEAPLFHCFVADFNGDVVGIALVYPRYSTWRGPVIHLEDLIVTKAMRGKGIGAALLKRVVQYGVAKGVGRIGWEVLDWNEPAIKFYEDCGAIVMRDWHVVQMDDVAMKKFLEA